MLKKGGLVLASASPRRQELLKVIWPHDVTTAPQDIDESPLKGEKPRDYVKRVTLAKAASAARQYSGETILASDTCVAAGRRMLQKAANREEAAQQIDLLSGRRHRVLTGVVVIKPGLAKPLYRLAEVRVMVMRLSFQQKAAFLDSGQWKGVAVYRLQGLFGSFVKGIVGQPSAVLGLPLYETACLLGVTS